jgi:lysophospholipid acyltransferase (LPLAT)-like uncharacterized protein
MKVFIISFLINLYLKICFKIAKWEIIKDDFDKYKNQQFILLLWHGKIAMPIYFIKKLGIKNLNILSSSHGGMVRILDYIALKNGIDGIIKGSQNKNKQKAIKEVIEKINSGCSICITPDGPRGPRMMIKNNNILEIAIKKKIPILTCNYAVKSNITLKSWDRLMIPLPKINNKGVFCVKEIVKKEELDIYNIEELGLKVSQEMNGLSDFCHNFCKIKKIKPSKYSYKRKRF